MNVIRCDAPGCSSETDRLVPPWFAVEVGTDHGAFGPRHYCSLTQLRDYLETYARTGQLYPITNSPPRTDPLHPDELSPALASPS